MIVQQHHGWKWLASGGSVQQVCGHACLRCCAEGEPFLDESVALDASDHLRLRVHRSWPIQKQIEEARSCSALPVGQLMKFLPKK